MSLSNSQITELIAYMPQIMEGEARHNYSGRGMLGDTCLGFIYDSEREAILDMLAVSSCTNLDLGRLQLDILFQTYQIDLMGNGVILYFPILKTGSQLK